MARGIFQNVLDVASLNASIWYRQATSDGIARKHNIMKNIDMRIHQFQIMVFTPDCDLPDTKNIVHTIATLRWVQYDIHAKRQSVEHVVRVIPQK